MQPITLLNKYCLVVFLPWSLVWWFPFSFTWLQIWMVFHFLKFWVGSFTESNCPLPYFRERKKEEKKITLNLSTLIQINQFTFGLSLVEQMKISQLKPTISQFHLVSLIQKGEKFNPNHSSTYAHPIILVRTMECNSQNLNHLIWIKQSRVN